MSDRKDVIIYMRFVRLTVVIPELHVWDFMKEFGVAFAVNDAHAGTTNVKAVDGYHDHPNGWHVHVTVWEHYEERFYAFLHEFCQQKGISFRDPIHPDR